MQKNLRRYRQLVREILNADEKSRCSDMWLYTVVIEMTEIDGLTDREKRLLIDLIRRARLPVFSTIMRERQKLQAEQPSLFDKLTIKKRRELAELHRTEYAKKK